MIRGSSLSFWRLGPLGAGGGIGGDELAQPPLGVHLHGAELPEAEDPAAAADARLPVERRPAVAADHEPEEEHHRQHDQRQRQHDQAMSRRA